MHAPFFCGELLTLHPYYYVLDLARLGARKKTNRLPSSFFLSNSLSLFLSALFFFPSSVHSLHCLVSFRKMGSGSHVRRTRCPSGPDPVGTTCGSVTLITQRGHGVSRKRKGGWVRKEWTFTSEAQSTACCTCSMLVSGTKYCTTWERCHLPSHSSVSSTRA